jgi:hypothetical protein
MKNEDAQDAIATLKRLNACPSGEVDEELVAEAFEVAMIHRDHLQPGRQTNG